MTPNSELSLVPGSRRGKPGRPRKGDTGIFTNPGSGHSYGHSEASVPQPMETANEKSVKLGASVIATVVPIAPRLLDLHGAAAYLALSEFTVRELEQQGILSRVRIPLPNHGELRKLLFDKAELDLLVEAWKER